MANNATQQQIMPQMMVQMVQFVKQMSTVQQQIQQQASTTSLITTNAFGSRCQRGQINISSYCWSRGASLTTP